MEMLNSMHTLNYVGAVTNGKLVLSDFNKAKMATEIAAFEGKNVEISIKKLPRRSIPQNAYYWGVVVSMVGAALRDLGHRLTNDEVHDLLKSKFNSTAICNADGELIGEYGQSTKEMNKAQFMDYLAAIQEFSATYLGVIIPDPDTQTEFNF